MSRGEDDEEEMKEGDDEEKVFRAAADVVATFPINNEIISSEIRRVMSAIKIDPRLWWIRTGKAARACGVRGRTRTHTHSPSDLPMIIEHS